jgi:hypothetical protein
LSVLQRGLALVAVALLAAVTALAIIEQRRDELAAQAQGCPSMVLSSTDVEGRWTFGEGDGPQVVGSAGDLAWWLVGRGGGHGLTSSAALPTLGRWR